MRRLCDSCGLSLGRAGHGHVRGSAVLCGDCEHGIRRRERKAEQREKLDQARRRHQERLREVEVARKVDEWRRVAA